MVRSYPFTSDSKSLETWINEILMSTRGHSTNAVAEGLASCLQLFDFEDRARPKICILVANSYPYEHECRTPKAVYAGGDCYSLADSFAEKQILLSIFMPRKIEQLMLMFKKAKPQGGSDGSLIKSNYISHILLIRGYFTGVQYCCVRGVGVWVKTLGVPY